MNIEQIANRAAEPNPACSIEDLAKILHCAYYNYHAPNCLNWTTSSYQGQWMKAAEAALAALSKSPWTPCSERMPTREDANERGEVLWLWTELDEVVCRKWNWLHRDRASLWMPISPLPKPITCPTCGGPQSSDIACPTCMSVQQPGQPDIVGEGFLVDFKTVSNKQPSQAPPPGYHIATEEELECLPVGSLARHKQTGQKWNTSVIIGEKATKFYSDRFWVACPDLPAQQFVQLGPEDIKPGDAIRPELHDERFWNLVESTTMTGVIVSWFGSDDTPSLRHFTFGQLFHGGLISRDNGKTWAPCRKPAPLSTSPTITSISKDIL